MGELFSEFPIWSAFFMTIKVCLLAGLIAFVLGTVVAIMRLSPMPILRSLGALYVNLIRNTPLTLLVAFSQMGLAMTLGWHLDRGDLYSDNFRWGAVALGVYTAAFVCEAIRSGVNTVPVGQAEAARSIGLGFRQTLGQVVLPQAFRAAIVPLGSTLIAMIKNSTVVSVIGVAEIAVLQADAMEQRPDLMYWILAVVALGFIVLTLPLGLATTHFGKRLAVKR